MGEILDILVEIKHHREDTKRDHFFLNTIFYNILYVITFFTNFFSYEMRLC